MKVVLVTGASRGLGAAICESLLRNSHSHHVHVVATARSVADLEALKARLDKEGQERMEIVAMDLAQPEAPAVLIDTCLRRFGRLDCLVNNAGVVDPIQRIADLDLEKCRKTLEVNFFSVLRLIQVAIPSLRESHGTVINISSGAATTPYIGWSSYCASKAALGMVTQCLAKEEHDISCIAIRPGVVDTPMQSLIRSEGGEAMGSDYDRFVQFHANKELVAPEVVGGVIARLCLRHPLPEDWNGQTLSWNDPKIQDLFQLKL